MDEPGAPFEFYESGALGHTTSQFLRDGADARSVGVNLGDRLAELDGLGYLRADLDELLLSAVWTRRPSLRPLLRFRSLRSLGLGGDGQLSDMQVLGELTSLEEVWLNRRAAVDLAALARLPRLWHLEVSFGSLATSVAAVADAPNLRWLDLSYLRSLTSLDGIGASPVLQRLDLAQLSNLQELPDLTGATALRTVVIEHCRNLRDLSPLAGAPALDHLLLIDMPQLTADDVRVLRGHPTLRRAAVGTGSARRNMEIAEVLGLPPSPGLVRPRSPFG